MEKLEDPSVTPTTCQLLPYGDYFGRLSREPTEASPFKILQLNVYFSARFDLSTTSLWLAVPLPF